VTSVTALKWLTCILKASFNMQGLLENFLSNHKFGNEMIMKIVAVAFISLWILAGCNPSRVFHEDLAATRTTESATWHMSLPWGYTNTVALSATQGAAVSNYVLYTKRDAFLEFVGGLPAGSVLDHDAGCVVPASYEIGDETITVETLKAFCKQRGIKVRINGSW
jgi:hypothetical protein